MTDPIKNTWTRAEALKDIESFYFDCIIDECDCVTRIKMVPVKSPECQKCEDGQSFNVERFEETLAKWGGFLIDIGSENCDLHDSVKILDGKKVDIRVLDLDGQFQSWLVCLPAEEGRGTK